MRAAKRAAPPWSRRSSRGPWATRTRSKPFSLLLTTIPSLPRPLLSRLTARLIDRLDEIDADPDLEDGHDAEEFVYG